MKKMLIGLLVLVLAGLSVACGRSAENVAPTSTWKGATYTATTTYASPRFDASFPSDQSISKDGYSSEGSSAGGGNSYSGYSPVPTSSVDRMVVRTGNISLVVSDISTTLDNIAKMAVDFGGYVVTSQKWKEGERNNGNISFRVLAENYDKAVAALRGISLDVLNETSSSQDVTQEYSDLGASLKNLEATETQLLKIMESATKTEDILSIQRELTNVRGQIEQTKGRMLYLERTSATSLINVKLSEAMLTVKFNADKVRADIDQNILFTTEINGGFEPYNYLWDFGDGNTSVEKAPSHAYKDAGTYSVAVRVTDDKGYTNSSQRSEYIVVAGSWNPGSVARSAWNGFAAFGRAFVNVLIWLAIFSPVWIVIGGLIWFLVWRSRRKKV
jgi:PKD repeat protein